MKKKMLLLLYAILCAFVLNACAPQQDDSNRMDYDQTKKMIVDILKTDEGKKAIENILQDEQIKKTLVMDQAMVKQTIQSTLTSKKGMEFWKEAFNDPQFVKTFAKSLRSEHEDLLKQLMKDPDYQALLLDVFKNPEMQKQMAQAMKTQDFRKNMQKVIVETLDSPLYKAKLEAIIQKAVQQSTDTSSGKENKKQEDDSSGSGSDQEQQQNQ
ncbi:spore germination lipoprotein GerD [Priestia koreensis]|uniref:Spore gernimation protein GerD n=1 Tax=Priestia koreensis TaxID=284581 RepID=A0A0M0KPX9_9BACI|nr:spore germination lipoprotein GerD [Priestia koreensis]KOO40906.1 spore gernimation protein GerD [Priestia koreensis]